MDIAKAFCDLQGKFVSQGKRQNITLTYSKGSGGPNLVCVCLCTQEILFELGGPNGAAVQLDIVSRVGLDCTSCKRALHHDVTMKSSPSLLMRHQTRRELCGRRLAQRIIYLASRDAAIMKHRKAAIFSVPQKT